MLRWIVIMPVCWAACLQGLGWVHLNTLAQAASRDAAPTNAVVILALQGDVDVLRAGATVWDPAWTYRVERQQLYAGDRLRTGENSRVWLRLINGTTTTVGPQSEARIVVSERERSRLSLLRGLFYFFHRSDPDDLEIETPMLAGAVRGTEFSVEVLPDGTTTVRLVDGALVASAIDSPDLELRLSSGEELLVAPGEPVRRTAMIDAVAVIQWCLYYPAILDVGELEFLEMERKILEASIGAYRRGDLPDALALYPSGNGVGSPSGQLYHAALLLSVGEVERAETLIEQALQQDSGRSDERVQSRHQRIGTALLQMIATVRGPPIQTRTSRDSGQRIITHAGTSRAQNPDEEDARAGARNIDSGGHSLESENGGRDGIRGRGESRRPYRLATEWMADSYRLQSLGELPAALEAARRAVEVSPFFGYGWVRVAELEFSLGHTRRSKAALDRATDLAPRNAQAMALTGFVLAAENEVLRARLHFDDAIAQDPALGNAWLGRGLTRIRLGDVAGGIEDLQMAATLEPQRAVLRSYLAKAFDLDRQGELAHAELERAMALDPADPTAWFYAALIGRQQGEINTAVRQLEHSTRLNDNRHLFRSRLLLDQDRAVRGANLAELYDDAGMADVAHREASRAVSVDYANFSAHRFLADSYNALRDTRQVTLRYETPWLSEYLMANLLAPVGAGPLSPSVTAQEYSRLFEQDRLGFTSRTTYSSRGDWQQNAVQHGVLDSTAYAIEVNYLSQKGDRPNQDMDQLNLTWRFKEQLTPNDSLYLQGIYYRADGGDLTPHQDPDLINPRVRIKERQAPILLAGLHRQWKPGLHSLVLGGYLDDTLAVTNPEQIALFSAGALATNLLPVSLDQGYRSEFRAVTAESQQIWQTEPVTLIVGGRYQDGTFRTRNEHRAMTGSPSPIIEGLFAEFLPADQRLKVDFARAAAYTYTYWRMVEPLQLVGGVSYDHLTYPNNHRYAPIGAGESSKVQLSPKAGLIWAAGPRSAIRAAYARSLGGVGIDHSFQLEPTQVAGITQTYRSLIPEAITGASAAERFETAGLSLEHAFPGHTFLALGLDWRTAQARRKVGVFNLEFDPLAHVVPRQARETFEFEEWVVTASARQLIGHGLSLGGLYQFSRAELDSRLDGPGNFAGPTGGTGWLSGQEADLHHLNLFSVLNHSSGVFGRFEALWYRQRNNHSLQELSDDQFWHFNVALGYRLPRRHIEVTAGIYNLTDQDYRLNPLNLTPRLFRERTFALDVRFSL